MTPLPMPADPARLTPASDYRRPGTRFVGGDLRIAGWVGIQKVACPLDHPIRHGWVAVGPHTRRCGFRQRGTDHECALLTWELWVPHAGIVFVSEIDRTDLESIREMTVEQTLAYLGAPIWTPRRRIA